MSKTFKIVPVLRLDHSPVAEVGVPGHAGVREFPPPAAGTGGRRAGDPALQVPDAALHRHGARRQPGPWAARACRFPASDSPRAARIRWPRDREGEGRGGGGAGGLFWLSAAALRAGFLQRLCETAWQFRVLAERAAARSFAARAERPRGGARA